MKIPNTITLHLDAELQDLLSRELKRMQAGCPIIIRPGTCVKVLLRQALRDNEKAA